MACEKERSVGGTHAGAPLAGNVVVVVAWVLACIGCAALDAQMYCVYMHMAVCEVVETQHCHQAQIRLAIGLFLTLE